MDAILEPPAALPRLFRFTPENARAMAAKGAEARRLRKAQLEAEAKAGREATRSSDERTKDIEAELDRLLEMMSASKDADEIRALSAARKNLRDEWQVLTGTPNPGSRKAKSPRATAPPLEPLPEPKPVPNEPQTPQ